MRKIVTILLSTFTVLFFIIGSFFGVKDLIEIPNPYENDADSNAINLSTYMTDFIITNGGEYTLKGTLKDHSVIIKAPTEDVKLNLRGVNISASGNAGLINEGTGTLTLNLASGIENEITDAGVSINYGAISANGDLIIDGEGILKISSNQIDGVGILGKSNITLNAGNINIVSKSSGIETQTGSLIINGGSHYINADKNGVVSKNIVQVNNGILYAAAGEKEGAFIESEAGYIINGGTLIGFNNDKLNCALETSLQSSLCVKFEYIIERETIIVLTNENEELIMGIDSEKRFKNMVISSPKLVPNNYKFYTDGTISAQLQNRIYSNGDYKLGRIIKINDTELFAVANKVNKYGDDSQ